MTIQVVEWIQSWQNGFFDLFFNFISFLGEEYVYIVIMSVLFFAVDKKLGEFSALMLFFTGMFNAVIKGLVTAERPFQKYPDRVTNLRPETSGGYSFPSGHTQMFTAFSFGIAVFTKQKRIFIGALIFSVLMAISRMYLGVHFLEDVGVSLILGVATAYILFMVFDAIKDDDTKLMQLYIGLVLLFLPFVIFINYEDLYKTYGLMVGFTGGIYLEKRFVQFTMDVIWWKKTIRVVGGLIVMIAVMIGLDLVFTPLAEEGTTVLHLLDGLRYGLVSFLGLGLYPFLFKRFRF